MIYLTCPSNYVSGGPEALFQLCKALRDTGYESQMFFPWYEKEKYSSPICNEYLHYGNPYTLKAIDAPGNYLVLPESMNISEMPTVVYSKKIMWWLSVDNFTVRNTMYDRNQISKFLNLYFDYHLVQSEYARKYCIDDLGIPAEKIFYISDYLNDSYISKANDNVSKVKKNQVLFNPQKGFEFTKKLLYSAPDIIWVPLINMTFDEVRDAMQVSKVYIDFGNHPGMDRLPREAAINGCCVLTDRRGAAAFHEDVPIPDKYKFDDTSDAIPSIITAIRSLFHDYDSAKRDFDEYRNWIIGEKERFYSDVESGFKDIIVNSSRGLH